MDPIKKIRLRFGTKLRSGKAVIYHADDGNLSENLEMKEGVIEGPKIIIRRAEVNEILKKYEVSEDYLFDENKFKDKIVDDISNYNYVLDSVELNINNERDIGDESDLKLQNEVIEKSRRGRAVVHHIDGMDIVQHLLPQDEMSRLRVNALTEGEILDLKRVEMTSKARVNSLKRQFQEDEEYQEDNSNFYQMKKKKQQVSGTRESIEEFKKMFLFSTLSSMEISTDSETIRDFDIDDFTKSFLLEYGDRNIEFEDKTLKVKDVINQEFKKIQRYKLNDSDHIKMEKLDLLRKLFVDLEGVSVSKTEEDMAEVTFGRQVSNQLDGATLKQIEEMEKAGGFDCK